MAQYLNLRLRIGSTRGSFDAALIVVEFVGSGGRNRFRISGEQIEFPAAQFVMRTAFESRSSFQADVVGVVPMGRDALQSIVPVYCTRGRPKFRQCKAQAEGGVPGRRLD